MTTAENPPERPMAGGRRSGRTWALRALIVLAVLAPVASFVYPWLVAYGVLG